MTSNISSSDAPKPTLSAGEKRLILGILTIATFMVVIDFSIVQIALPTIKTQFAVPISQLQWIVTGYSLTYAGFLMLSGRMGDIYGRKKLFIAGILIFSFSSLAGGLSPNLIFLILARVVQGVGAAIGSATGLSILMATFPEGPERNNALSLFSAILSSGFAAGVVLGGFMTSALGWRSVLLINVPIGIIGSIIALKYMPESIVHSEKRSLDLPGSITITLGLIILVYSLIQAETFGFLSSQTLSVFVVAVVILAIFVIIETRSKDPLIPFSFFKRSTVLSSNVIAMILSATTGGLIFVQTIFIQQILNYPPLSAGLLFLPQAAIFMITAGYLSSKLVNRFGAKKVILSGIAIAIVGFVYLTTITANGGYLGLLPGLVLTAVGDGISWTAINIVALEGAKHGEEGLASGIFNTSIQVGGPLGLAILLTIAATQTQAISSNSVSAASLVGGFRYAFAFAAALTFIALLITIRIKSEGRSKDKKAQEEMDVPAAPPGMSEGMIPLKEEE